MNDQFVLMLLAGARERRQKDGMTSTYCPTPPSRVDAAGASVQRWRAGLLGALSLTFACVALDNTKLVLAVPTLARAQFATSGAAAAALHWFAEANLVVYASLLLLGGALSERLGARRMLQIGLSCFTLGSLLSAFAGSVLGLYAGRVAVGLGAALMVPASLAAIEHLFGGPGRARAVAVWTGSFALAAALGPLLGGVVLERWGFPALMLINVPFALLALAAVSGLVPGSLPRRTAPVDVLGAVLGVAASVCTLSGLLGGQRGVTAALALGGGAALFSLLALWQRRARHPMLDPMLFRRPPFRWMLLVISLAYLAFSGSSFAVAQYLQVVRGHAPSTASLFNLPLSLSMLAGTLAAPRLFDRLGPARTLGVSLRLSFGGALGAAGACFVQSDVALCVALVPFAAGAGSAFASVTPLILELAPAERAGSAAAISETAFELGGVLGVALLGARLGTLSGPRGAGVALVSAALAFAVAAWIGRRGVGAPRDERVQRFVSIR
jgi:DHA2 family multidrug resistance protein-like MFS transporter